MKVFLYKYYALIVHSITARKAWCHTKIIFTSDSDFALQINFHVEQTRGEWPSECIL